MSVGLFATLTAIEEGLYEENFVLDALASDTVLQSDDTPVTNNTQPITKWLNREKPDEFCNVTASNTSWRRNPGTATVPPSVSSSLTSQFFVPNGNLSTYAQTNPIFRTLSVPGPRTLMNNFHYFVFSMPSTSWPTPTYLLRIFDYPFTSFTTGGHHYNYNLTLNSGGDIDFGIGGPGANGSSTIAFVKKVAPSGFVKASKRYIVGVQWEVIGGVSAPNSITVFARHPDTNVLSIGTCDTIVIPENVTTRGLLWSMVAYNKVQIHEVGHLQGLRTNTEIEEFTANLHTKWNLANWQA